MDDLISRQWLMECFNEGWIKFDTKKDESRFIHLVRDIAPSAEPVRIKGRWVKENIVLTSNPPQYQWHCSECGGTMYGFSAEILTDFCPNCGADMRGEEDGMRGDRNENKTSSQFCDRHFLWDVLCGQHCKG